MWCVLFSWNTRFEIHPFPLLPTNSSNFIHIKSFSPNQATVMSLRFFTWEVNSMEGYGESKRVCKYTQDLILNDDALTITLEEQLCHFYRKRLKFIPSIRFQKFEEKLKYYNWFQEVNFSIKDFFSKCDQIRSPLRIWSHLPKKSL